jgi:hypothetical protein
MTGKELAEQAIKNRANAAVLNGEREANNKAAEREVSRLKYDVYRDKIRELEYERDRKVDEVEQQAKAITDQKDAEIKELYVVIRKVEKVLEFLRLDPTSDLTVKDEDVKPYNHYEIRTVESLGYYLDDPYLKVKLYLAQNGKPVNKYSLIAIGKCLFSSVANLVNIPRTYGLPVNVWGYHLEVLIKDFQTAGLAKTWLENNRRKLDLKGDYETVKAEYLEAVQNYKVEDFQDLLIARCTCGYYYTVFDVYRLSIRTGVYDCARCKASLTIKVD